MSGSALERIQKREVLKDGDVCAALRELAARVEALEGNEKVNGEACDEPVKKPVGRPKKNTNGGAR